LYEYALPYERISYWQKAFILNVYSMHDFGEGELLISQYQTYGLLQQWEFHSEYHLDQNTIDYSNIKSQMDLNYTMKTNQGKIIPINGNYEFTKTAIRANEHNINFNIVSMETVTKLIKGFQFLVN
jgi:hypothetical protein